MRTRSTIQPVLLGDKGCSASCTQGKADPEHFHRHSSPIETAQSTDSLMLESSLISDEVLQDQWHSPHIENQQTDDECL